MGIHGRVRLIKEECRLRDALECLRPGASISSAFKGGTRLDPPALKQRGLPSPKIAPNIRRRHGNFIIASLTPCPRTTFALVHGAWHGGWARDALSPELRARGHDVIAPDLPCEDTDVGSAEYARLVIDALDGQDDAIVVGHSLGGMTIPLVPARIHVWLCAYVPQPDRALVDRGEAAFGPGFAASTLRDDLERSYCSDLAAAAHDLQYPADAARLAERLRRQARRPSTEPSPVTAIPTTQRAYIVCADDYAVPPDRQRRVRRDALGVEPIELASGHSPMLACPGELAEILHRLATREV